MHIVPVLLNTSMMVWNECGTMALKILEGNPVVTHRCKYLTILPLPLSNGKNLIMS
jgi:hypothetical protein